MNHTIICIHINISNFLLYLFNQHYYLFYLLINLHLLISLLDHLFYIQRYAQLKLLIQYFLIYLLQKM